jgi:prepilin peptidase CpaA
MNTEILPILILCLGMTIAVIQDLRTRKIPNLLTFPMMLLGFVYHGAMSGLSGFGFSTAGVGIGIGVFLIPYLMGGMGAGDAKLMAAAGAFLGAKGAIIAAVISILIGLFYAAVVLFIHMDYGRSFVRRAWITLKTFLLTRQFIPIPPGKDEKQPVLNYALPNALGTMCYLFLKITGSDLIQHLLGFQFTN